MPDIPMSDTQAAAMTAEGRHPREPLPGELCIDCTASATWAFSVMGPHPKAIGRAIFCDKHAEFYLQRGPDIYPAAHRASR